MSKYNKKLIISTLVILSIAIVLIFYFQTNIATKIRDIIKPIQILINGGDIKFFNKTINNQSIQTDKLEISNLTLETAYLPINVHFSSLPRDFAEGGGAITSIKNNIILMSRVGKFYKYSLDSFSTIEWEKLPNEIDNYILKSRGGLSIDAFRASYIFYNEYDRKIYASYTKYVSPDKNRLEISSLQIDPDTLKHIGKWKTVFRSDLIDYNYGSQAGGGRLIARGNFLYFSIGYSDQSTKIGNRTLPSTQNTFTNLGKIFRINLNSNIVELISIGHRNVQGLTFTNFGELIATEHGPQGGDEINLIKQDKNYGWPYHTYGTDYGKYTYVSPFKESENLEFEEPLFTFVPSMAISPIITVNNFHSSWNGNILVGSLKAQSLFRLIIKSGRVILSEPIWIGHRIRDITLIQDKIVILTDDSYLLNLEVNSNKLISNIKYAGYSFERKLERCLVCHHFEITTPTSQAPSLKNIVGRKIAGDSYEKYSNGLKIVNGIWQKDNLKKYISDPNLFAPGTTMPKLNLSQDEVNEIVEILAK